MKINNIKIDKTANYPKSFYKKFKEEQMLYKEKTGTNPKEINNCTTEEVDCEKSIVSLAYAEPKYKLQGKPVKKRIKIVNKQQISDGRGNAWNEKQSTGNKSAAKRSTNPSSLVKAGTGKSSSRKVGTDKVNDFKISTENEGTIKIISEYSVNNPEEEKCIIEEVDCKMSLINIGYDETEEEDESEAGFETGFEAEMEDGITDLAENPADGQECDTTSRIVESSDNSEADNNQDYDINRYFSSGIIDTVVIYTDDMEDVIEETEETGNHGAANQDVSEKKITDPNGMADVDNIVDENNTAGKNNIIKDDSTASESNAIEDNDICENNITANNYINDTNNINNEFNSYQDQISETNRSRIEKSEIEYRYENLKRKILAISNLNSKLLLHFKALHIKNKLGYLSLPALLGILGIFTENKACLGFWAFLYYFRYFFIIPDEYINGDIQKAAAPAFITGISISLLSVVLEALFNDVLLLIVGTGIGTVISILVFTVYLAIIQMRRNAERKP
ncbi:MAG: DUF3796 domain-containing protein [Anaerocolumna sp.]